MKRVLVLAVLCFSFQSFAQKAEPPATLKTVLLQELRETHNQKQWFVSLKEATAGLTPEQAAWTDGKGNHSVGQLVYHLWFWNADALAKLKGEPEQKFSGNNDDTFTKYDPKEWESTSAKLDEVMNGLEKLVESADDAKLAKIAPTIARISEHNAYHIGEMIVVRKQQGAWNPETGVK